MWRGWQHTAFNTSLPSDLPGSVFTAHVKARWRSNSKIPAHVIRARLRDEIAAVTVNRSVAEIDAATDAALTKLAQLTIDHSGSLATVHTGLELKVDIVSKRLADQRLKERREVQIRHQEHRAWLAFLRDEVFADPALARIWWLQQRPELITAVGERTFLDAIAAAETAKTTDRTHQDAIVHIMEELVTGLLQDAENRSIALRLLDKMLNTFRPDLSIRLQRLEPALSNSEVGPQTQVSTYPNTNQSGQD
jgi:hypothetical protein